MVTSEADCSFLCSIELGGRAQGITPEIVEIMVEALRTEVAGQEDTEVAMWSDPLRWSLPQHQLRTHTPPRLPALVTHSLRQAAARLFTVRAAPLSDHPPPDRCT